VGSFGVFRAVRKTGHCLAKLGPVKRRELGPPGRAVGQGVGDGACRGPGQAPANGAPSGSRLRRRRRRSARERAPGASPVRGGGVRRRDRPFEGFVPGRGRRRPCAWSLIDRHLDTIKTSAAARCRRITIFFLLSGAYGLDRSLILLSHWAAPGRGRARGCGGGRPGVGGE